MGGLHSHSEWADQVGVAAGESCEEELLGVWSTGSQVQDGELKWQTQYISTFKNIIYQDNEFELVFVIAYQKMLPLLYLDKLLDEIQLRWD